MENIFNKIIIVSLCDEFTVRVGKVLSQNLDMLFCDTKELVEYELINRDALKKISSKEYLKNAETRVLKHIASFENVVVAINFDYLIHNFNILKSESIVVFLNLTKKFVGENGNKLNALSYEEKSQKLKEVCTISVNVKKTDENLVCNKIIDEIGGIL